MRQLGFKPTKNSGAGWIEKEDGQNDYLIAQLKSTDAMSIKVNLKDINVLEYNAAVTHKVPCFIIQFLQSDDVFVLARPTDLKLVSDYIETGTCYQPTALVGELVKGINEESKQQVTPMVRSTPKARDKFWNDRQKAYEKEGNAKWKRK